MAEEAFIDPDILRKVYLWMDGPFPAEEKKEVERALKHHPEKLRDAFYKELDFGTGGVRALMGYGTNRLNVYTIRKITQGLASYLLKAFPNEALRVAICYDPRRHSLLFAEETAKVLLGNGIEVFLPDGIRPTPFASFVTRYKKCHAGVMLTASHNPPEYHGYKVYWGDGSQVVAPHDTGIKQEIDAIEMQLQVQSAELSDPKFHRLEKEVDEAYLKEIASLQLHEGDQGKDLKIIYSPLHGSGIKFLPSCLASWGFSNLSFVEKQKEPDENFTHAPSPNPENGKALELGSKQLIAENGDIFIATDPDADRIGVVVNHRGMAKQLTGNQVAALCVYYLCQELEQTGALPEKGAFVTTIVTTPLVKTIAANYHKPCFELLTGFKYIAEKIRDWEKDRSHTFIFGAEESCGYLYGTYVRDKDAMISACLIADMALSAKREGKSLLDMLNEIYAKFGVHQEKVLSVSYPEGMASQEAMEQKMEALRKYPPRQLLDMPVVILEDYLESVRVHFVQNEKEALHLPQSNVLCFILADQTKLIVRPSGTEPKIKVYAMTHEKTPKIEEGIAACGLRLEKLLESFKVDYL